MQFSGGAQIARFVFVSLVFAGVIANFNLFGEGEYWKQAYRRLYQETRPFIDLPVVR